MAHMFSLIAARRLSLNMHGVSPYADVLSYRIFNDSGSFGIKTGLVRLCLNEVATDSFKNSHAL